MSDLISVVLPVFNAASTVARAVESILAQSHRNLELIVVDDGSTDDTAAIVAGISDPRLRLIQSDHRGVAAAANLGTREARGKHIARMDADDYAYDARLERQLALLLEGGFDVVGCQVRIVEQTGPPAAGMRRYEAWINEETLEPEAILALRFVEFPIVNPTILARREYFELAFRDGQFPEDYDLMLRAAAGGMRFAKVPDVLLDWTDSVDGLTRNDPHYTPEAFDRCRRIHLLGGPLREVREVDLWGVGQTGKPWLRWLQRSGLHVRRAYDVNVRQIGQTIHGVRIAHPDAMQSADGTPLVIAVGAEGARELIRPHLRTRGYVCGADAWFVA
ncbi:MAG: glycosyltransferase [Pirellulales bacterium]|nr:glycosyltransferase [Pirellulales bacterium]